MSPMRKTSSHYTMVEILVVLAVIGIILTISVGGIGKLMGRQGATGAVRNISSKLSLARSYAVMKNSYVALLMPGDNPDSPSGFTTGFTTNDRKQEFYYANSRLCLVTSSADAGIYTFSEWLDGNEWETLPRGSCAYVFSNPARVNNITINAAGGPYTVTTQAVVFKPSGTLANAGEVKIKVFMAKYVPANPTGEQLVHETASREKNAWQITVNPFTGRTNYEKKTDN